MPFPLAAALMAGGGVVGSVVNAISQNHTNNKTLEFNAVEAQKARQWNEQMYNKYNSPIAQVQQFKDAGLNPNLLYGNGTTIPPVQSSAQANATSLQAPRWGDAVTNAVSSALDIELKKAQIANVNADTNKKDSETAGQSISNTFASRSLDFRLDALALDNNNKRIQSNLMVTETDKNVSYTKFVEQQTQNMQYELKEILPLKSSELGALIMKHFADAKKSNADALLTDEERQYVSYNATTRRIEANASAKNAETNSRSLDLQYIYLPYNIAKLCAERNLTEAQTGQVYKASLETLAKIDKLKAEKELITEQTANQILNNAWSAQFGNAHEFGKIKTLIWNMMGMSGKLPYLYQPTKNRKNK